MSRVCSRWTLPWWKAHSMSCGWHTRPGPGGQGDERGDLLVGERESRCRLAVFGGHGARGVGERGHGLGAERPTGDAPGRGVGDVVVGLDLPRDQRLAEPEGRVDDHLAAVAGERVGREEHAGNVRRHEPLDDDGQRRRVVGDEVAPPIDDGPGRPQARPAVPDGGQQGLLADDAEVGVLLPGEGQLRQVLGRRRGAHRHRSTPEPLVCRAHGLGDLLRDGVARKAARMLRAAASALAGSPTSCGSLGLLCVPSSPSASAASMRSCNPPPETARR